MEQKYKIEKLCSVQLFSTLHGAMVTKDTTDLRVDFFHHLLLSNNIQLYNLCQTSAPIS